MANQTRKRKGRDPNQDVQPWLGWVAALLIVLVVVIAVAMGMERTNNQRGESSTVEMTPFVGGMQVTAVTPTPGDVATSAAVAVGIAPTTTVTTPAQEGSLTVTTTAPITTTSTVTATDAPTTTTTVTDTAPLTVTEVATATVTVTVTEVATATPPVDATTAVTPTQLAPTLAPPATSTPAPVSDTRTFAPGDIVVGRAGRVPVYADASLAASLLDTFGASVELMVVEPSGDYAGYPVLRDGESWLRVRALDGLVGWVVSQDVDLK